jgi:hypothetical protein
MLQVYDSQETRRLEEDRLRQRNWKRWGPYLSNRQWGTVREDYSAGGSCWDYLSHEQSRSRAYRWGEDGLLGICDRECRLCFSLCLWNGEDSILKERLFGLTGPEGNHGEDVKENYYYIDSTITHSYMKALYKYPQSAFPYVRLVSENRKRSKALPEFELYDTGVFDNNEYFDVFVEYAKNTPDDILIKVTIENRSNEKKSLHFLPTLWFRNNWSFGSAYDRVSKKPNLHFENDGVVSCWHETLGQFYFAYELPQDSVPEPLFTENETNNALLFKQPNASPYVKDAFHDYVIKGKREAVNPERTGTKFAAHYIREIEAKGSTVIRMRLSSEKERPEAAFDKEFDKLFVTRMAEADDLFYKDGVIHPTLTTEEKLVARQAYAGLLWTKQFYHYVIPDWLDGDKDQPAPPDERKHGRNKDWKHIYNRDIISMPDKWEYPWFAAWDLAFHMIPFSDMDAYFAKDQMILMLREWYMHPNGQIPAYEFNFSDVNPPVHAWAAWCIYKSERYTGTPDRAFLESVFQKLTLNFTWWVNRKDTEGNNLFSGGFLGLDNIGAFDRSQKLPTGGHLEQADGTAWMAFFCLNMFRMAMELAQENPVYEDMASKYFEHFVSITDAMNCLGGHGLWDEEDGFYYDQIHVDDHCVSLKIRSLVGLLPLIAVHTFEESQLANMPNFYKRMQWFLTYRADLAKSISYAQEDHDVRILAIPSRERLERLLAYLLDEDEFLSPYGIRSLSKFHDKNPYSFFAGGREHRVQYMPNESDTGMFGGNSNWRGPIWFPLNYLIVESLLRYYHFYGDALMVECPTRSGNMMNLEQVSQEIARRLSSIFLPDADGVRPCNGEQHKYADDPNWKNLVLFYEYFNPETGRGLGADHQTGWTALVADLLARERWDKLLNGARVILDVARS